MTRFSQRVGGQPAFSSGPEEASHRLRVATWNALHPSLLPTAYDARAEYRRNAIAIWDRIGLATDTVPLRAGNGIQVLRDYWFSCDWHGFFDVFEFCVYLIDARDRSSGHWYTVMDAILEQQGCAYRFIGDELAPITNPEEAATVAAASECAILYRRHIREALNQLPPNPAASPRNSIRSISAVEGCVQEFNGFMARPLAKASRRSSG